MKLTDTHLVLLSAASQRSNSRIALRSQSDAMTMWFSAVRLTSALLQLLRFSWRTFCPRSLDYGAQ
jgi:hypothetical protein